MTHRQRRLEQITPGLCQFRALELLCPRQAGKASLARLAGEWSAPTHHFDLGNAYDQVQLSDLLLFECAYNSDLTA